MPARKKNKKRAINLLPKEDFDRTTLGRILKWALTTFRFIVIVVEFVVIAGFLSRFWLDVRIGDLDDEIQQKSAIVAARYPFEVEYRKLQTKLSIISQIGNQANSVLPFLDSVSDNMPLDTQLLSLTKTDNILEIKGASFSEGSISQFLRDLRLTELFSQINLRRMEVQADSPLTEFTIEAIVLQEGGA